ncbi:hypothetical protein AB0D32_06850 [Micromonospora sp. NPDC048170]|uniref:hypothetical protein n=1 Tax=Micromonospora sp. NPDC048170 TaxID=3154819 RepID=UPI00340CC645
MRRKWFVSVRDGEPYSPFGLDCEGAATLYGERGGCNVAGPGRTAGQGVDDLARRNRDFWAAADRVATPTKPASWRRLFPGRPKGRST